MPKIFIGPFQTGLEKDIQPYLLPEDAFTELEDAYVFRGDLRKKESYRFLGRLHTTPALPEALAAVATGAATYSDTLAGPPISPATVTIVISTAPAMTFTDNGNGTLTSATVDVNFGTIDYETGTFTLNFAPVLPAGGPFAVNATAYRTLTRNPVMGLTLYENIAVNRETLIAFDVDNSYTYNTGLGIFDELQTGSWGINPQFTGTNSDFIWTRNYFRDAANNNLLWATNNVESDANASNGIQYYNGTTWTTQNAQVDAAGNLLRGALILIPYRNRLVALNTLEGAAAPAAVVRNPQRARWSQNGTPLIATDVNAWRQDIIGKGGFINAPTSQAIVSAGFVKDVLIVFFERSTWELRYTGNELLPFIWQQVNSELGAESSFSAIAFDDGLLAVGDRRIISANTAGVAAIDAKIPDEVYAFHNDNVGPLRVHGIRDFFRQLAIWTFPNAVQNRTFPNRMLVFNYENNSWAFFNDSFTALGYYQQFSDFTWANPPAPTWAEALTTWGSVVNQSFFPSVVGGTQSGFVEVLMESSDNEQSLDLIGPGAITNASPAVFTITNHNLDVGQFIRLNFTRAFPASIVAESLGTAVSGSTTFNIALQNRGVIPGTAVITMGAITFTDVGDGSLNSATAGASGVINYQNGYITLSYVAIIIDTAVTASYDYNILNTRPFEVFSATVNTFTLRPYQADVVNEAVATTGINTTTFTGTLDSIPIVPGTAKFIMGTNIFRDNGDGTLDSMIGGSTIDYENGEFTLLYALQAGATAITASYSWLSQDLASIGFAGAAAPYDGTGEVSIINDMSIKTKRFSPFVAQDEDIRINYLNMLLRRNPAMFETRVFAGADDNDAVSSFTVSSDIEDGSNLASDQIWKKVYVNSTSDFIQLGFALSAFQKSIPRDYGGEFIMGGLLINTQNAGRLK